MNLQKLQRTGICPWRKKMSWLEFFLRLHKPLEHHWWYVLFTVLRALPLPPRKVFDNFWDGFHFKCPVKLQQLATGFKCLQIDNFEALKRVNGEFDNFWLFGWKRSQQKAQNVLKKISKFNQKLSKVQCRKWMAWCTALYIVS